jgi:predicted ATPase
MNSRFVCTGGPGAGKTTVLEALQARGYRFTTDSARTIIKDRLRRGLSPRPEPKEFAQLILESELCKYAEHFDRQKPTFFDRGVLDAIQMLKVVGAVSDDDMNGYIEQYRYNSLVFIFPPWAEIYRTDEERDQTFEESVSVFTAIREWYSKNGYEVIDVPRVGVEDRAAFIADAASRALKSSATKTRL